MDIKPRLASSNYYRTLKLTCVQDSLEKDDSGWGIPDIEAIIGGLKALPSLLDAGTEAMRSKLEGSLMMMQALRACLIGAPGWTAGAESHLLAYMAEVRALLDKY